MPIDNENIELIFLPMADLLQRAPFMADFFSSLGLEVPPGETTPADYFTSLDGELLEDLGLERESLADPEERGRVARPVRNAEPRARVHSAVGMA